MKAWLFDVDGTLTNPAVKKVIYPQIFDEIINGRSSKFLASW